MEEEEEDLPESSRNPGWWRAVHPYVSPRHQELNDEQRLIRDIAYRIKEGDDEAIEIAAGLMSQLVPRGAVIVPAPGSARGSFRGIDKLAQRIASLTGGLVVAAVVRTSSVESSRARRVEGLKGLTPEEHVATMELAQKIDGRVPIVIVDNVAATGATLEAVRTKLAARGGDVTAVVWAEADYRTVNLPAARNSDDRLRKIEREAARGDDEAAQRLASERRRAGLTNVRLRLKRLPDTDEWKVAYMVGRRCDEDKSYYTTDKADAIETMNAMQREIDGLPRKNGHDDRRRRLERQAAGGDEEAAQRLRGEQRRGGGAPMNLVPWIQPVEIPLWWLDRLGPHEFESSDVETLDSRITSRPGGVIEAALIRGSESTYIRIWRLSDDWDENDDAANIGGFFDHVIDGQVLDLPANHTVRVQIVPSPRSNRRRTASVSSRT